MNKYLILFLMTLLSVCTPIARAQQSTTLFPYPTAPEEKNSLSEKCNYLVLNFWDRCNIGQSFSSLDRLDDAFGTWASFMPYATSDTVHIAIDKYIADVAKQAPKNMVDLGRMAQKWFYCDSAEYYSEEIYMPFCKAVAEHKKTPKAEKVRYQAQLKVLESSAVGQRIPNFTFVRPDGSKENLDDVIASRIILFFNDPDCFDCTMFKTRLAADNNTNDLIERGLIKVVSIYPSEPTDEWKQIAAKYPENWIVGAFENADEYFDLSYMPSAYWLDGRHKVLSKNFDISNLLMLVQQINANQK